MDILHTIMSERRADAAAARSEVPLEELQELAAGRVHHGLRDVLESTEATCVVAEVKKASPSAGLLRPEYNPAGTAALFAAHGASGISVLSEPRHFLGSAQHLRDVRDAVDLPVLRKDFICDAYQVAETAAWGADVVLLILAALSEEESDTLHAAAQEYGLDVLAEAHTAGEVERAVRLEKAVIGVNSRNLQTLETDLSVAEELAERIPADCLSIAESGIKCRSDIESLEALGYRGFLVGEALMAAPDPGAKLDELRGLSS